MDNLTVDWAAVAVLVGSLITVMIGFATRKKLDSEAANEVSEAALSLLEPLRQRVSQLEQELGIVKGSMTELSDKLEVVERENNELRRGIWLLVHQVTGLGQEPVYRPREDR